MRKSFCLYTLFSYESPDGNK